jgi:L-rhamnose mutarotase
MKSYQGKVEEYKKRHDEIWPDNVQLLKGSGVFDYSIFFDAKSFLVNHAELANAQEESDVARAEKMLKEAFEVNTRPIVAEAIWRNIVNPSVVFREAKTRMLVAARGKQSVATGL